MLRLPLLPLFLQVVQHLPWDGLSFVNLLRSQPPTDKQAERLIITMQTQCIEDDFIPLLGRDRSAHAAGFMHAWKHSVRANYSVRLVC